MVRITPGSGRSTTGTSTAAGRVAATPARSHNDGSRSRSPRVTGTLGSVSPAGTSRVRRARARSKNSCVTAGPPAGSVLSSITSIPQACDAVGRRHREELAPRRDAEHASPIDVALLAEVDDIIEQGAGHLGPKIAAHVQERLEPAGCLRLEAQGMVGARRHPVVHIGAKAQDSSAT